jgi:hypothetical protein
LRHGSRLLDDRRTLRRWLGLLGLRLLLGRCRLHRLSCGLFSGALRLRRLLLRRGGGRGGACARGASAFIDLGRALRARRLSEGRAGLGEIFLRHAQTPRRKADSAADQQEQRDPDEHLA